MATFLLLIYLQRRNSMNKTGTPLLHASALLEFSLAYCKRHGPVRCIPDVKDACSCLKELTTSLMVESSSLLPVSISTVGRMQTGGTGTCVMIKFSGRPCRSRSSQSSSLMAVNRLKVFNGLRSSAICMPQATFRIENEVEVSDSPVWALHRLDGSRLVELPCQCAICICCIAYGLR